MYIILRINEVVDHANSLSEARYLCNEYNLSERGNTEYTYKKL